MTLNSNAPKKLGRPLGSKNKKRRVAKKVSNKDIAFKQDDVKKFIKNLNDSVVTDQEAIILNLEHQIVGYKAVISYLEYKLGKK